MGVLGRLYFRPLPGLSVAAIFLLAGLIGLGVWQLERLQWKLALIAQVERAMQASPVSVASALGGSENMSLADRIARADYRRVEVRGQFRNADEVYFFTTAQDGTPVVHVITPLVVSGLCAKLPTAPCGGNSGEVTILVDRGYVPLEGRDAATRPLGELEGEREVVGILRAPAGRSSFTPAPDRTHRTFYARDLPAIAQFLGLRRPFPMFLDADATPNPGGWPKGGQTQVTFRNEHLQYAITWFSLALALACIYLIYHSSKGRLGLRPRREDT